jgi:hypothetical protein
VIATESRHNTHRRIFTRSNDDAIPTSLLLFPSTVAAFVDVLVVVGVVNKGEVGGA